MTKDFTGLRFDKALNGIKEIIPVFAQLKEHIYELYRGLKYHQKDAAKEFIDKYDPQMAKNIDKEAGVDTMKGVFTNMYKNNIWGSEETRSGKGSTKDATKTIVKQLPAMFKKYNVKSIIDAPCGDYNWFKNLDYNFNKYLGIDIVDEIISENQKKYGSKSTKFQSGNILEYKFPKADLILCRDLFIHLTNKDVKACLKNFKNSGVRYLLTSSYPEVKKNEDTKTSYFRRINLLRPPFNLGKPLEVVSDNDRGCGKHLCLWDLGQL